MLAPALKIRRPQLESLNPISDSHTGTLFYDTKALSQDYCPLYEGLCNSLPANIKPPHPSNVRHSQYIMTYHDTQWGIPFLGGLGRYSGEGIVWHLILPWRKQSSPPYFKRFKFRVLVLYSTREWGFLSANSSVFIPVPLSSSIIPFVSLCLSPPMTPLDKPCLGGGAQPKTVSSLRGSLLMARTCP